MFKYNPFVVPKEHSTDTNFLKCGFYFRSSTVLNHIRRYLETLYSILPVSSYTTNGDEMSLPTRVRPVIVGIILSIIVVLNECVSTLFTFIPVIMINKNTE